MRAIAMLLLQAVGNLFSQRAAGREDLDRFSNSPSHELEP
jgi:hypothetical protein